VFKNRLTLCFMNIHLTMFDVTSKRKFNFRISVFEIDLFTTKNTPYTNVTIVE